MPIDFSKYGGAKSPTGVKKEGSIKVDFSKYSEPTQPSPVQQPIATPIQQPSPVQQPIVKPVQSPIAAPVTQTNKEMFKDLPSRKIPIIGSVLKLLDTISSNKAVVKVGDVGRALYTPGGTGANIAGFSGALGRKAFETAPKVVGALAGNVAGRVAQKIATGAAVGAPLTVGQYQALGGDDDKEALKQAGYGAAFGGGLGALGGTAGEVISAIRKEIAAGKVTKMYPAYDQAAKNRNVLNIGEIGRGNKQKTVKPIETNSLPEPIPSKTKSVPTKEEFQKMADSDEYFIRTVRTPEKDIAGRTSTPAGRIGIELGLSSDTHKGLSGFNLKDQSRMLEWMGKEGWEHENVAVYKGKPTREQVTLDPGEVEFNPDELIGYVPTKLFKEQGGDFHEAMLKHLSPELPTVKPSGVVDEMSAFKNEMDAKYGQGSWAKDYNHEELLKYDRLTKQANAEKVEPLPTAKPVTDSPSIEPAIPEPPAKPKTTFADDDQIERGFVTTLKESDKPPEAFKEKLKAAYTPITNQATVDAANKIVNADIEAAASYVLGKEQFNATKVATAHRLIDEFSKAGNHQRAVDIAESIAEEGTKAGQSIQAFSIYNRLSKEGILIHAQRIAKKTNESLPLGVKEVKVTPEMSDQIMDLAETTKTMTGVKDLSNDVMNILDRAKLGEKLNADDTDMLRKFVNDSKQFIEEVKPKAEKPPKPPQAPKDKRVRDNVISFLDAQEAAAKERLRARGIRVSSTPLDIWADYAIIGAAKMARGSIKFGEWSAQMVKDLGDEVKPHLQNLYERARETFEQSAKKVTTQTISEAEKIAERVINGKNLASTEADSLRKLAQKVSALSGEEKRVASQDLQAILQTLEKSGLLKKLSTVQTIGQLLNPKTQVRNSLGNELFYRLERLNKLIATPIDIARSKITGGPRSVTFKTNNQGEYWRNFMRGAAAGWRGVNINGLQTQFDLAGQSFRSKYNPLTYMEKALGASLRSFDNAAYMRAYNNTLGEQATLRAMNEGQAGNKTLIQKYIREADDNVMQIADEYGKYSTFQDNNMISVGLTKLKRGMNLGKDFGMGDLILKYPKTPGALLMRALEYSPAGFVRSASILFTTYPKESSQHS